MCGQGHSGLRGFIAAIKGCLGAFILLYTCAGCSHPTRTVQDEQGRTVEVDDVLALSGCEDLAKWMKEHPRALLCTAENKDWKVELRYHPALCIACSEKKNALFNDSMLARRTQELAHAQLYVLRVQARHPGQELPMTSALRQNITAIVGADTLHPVFVHREANAGVAPYDDLLVGFDEAESERTRVLLIQGLGTGIIRLELSAMELAPFFTEERTPV